jgi:putative glutamine amidotransferase
LETVWLAARDKDLDAEELARVDAVCLTGGADVEPARYGRPDAADVCSVDLRRDTIEWTILEHLQHRQRPTLAICRGAQILNVFHGGTLRPDLGALNAVHRAEPRINHSVRTEPGTLLRDAVGCDEGLVNSSHHQAVEQIAPPFRVSALALDGTVEAFERTDAGAHPFLLAVQWHPERMAAGERMADGVLDAFLLAASLVAR